MENNYFNVRDLENIASLAKKTKLRFSLTARYFAAAIALAFMPFATNAQVTANFTFDSGLQAWTTSGSGTFFQTTLNACGDGGSVRANVYYNNSNYFISPSLGIANADMVTMTFDYKVVEYEAQNQATPAAEVGMEIEWSNSASGPWTNAYTMPEGSHIESASCLSKTVSFMPTPGNLFVRIKSITTTGTADTYFYYDNIDFFQGDPPTCFPPTAISIPQASITQTSFTLNFTPPTDSPAEGYLYEVRSSGLPGSGATGLAASGSVAAGAITTEISGVSASNVYTVYMKSKCSATDLSSWGFSAQFTTLCGVADVPYIVPLETVNTPALPLCITMENLNNDSGFWKSAASTAGITGKIMAYNYNFQNAADDWFYTAPLNLSAGVVYQISFKYKVVNYEEKLKVSLGAAPNAAAMTTTLLDLTIPASNANATLQTIDFTPAATGVYNIGFQAHSDANKNSLYVGEISVVLGATCLAPTGIIATNLDKNTATIAWTESTTIPANGYSYEIRTSGVAGSGATGLSASGTTAAGILTADITGLMPSTDYKIYVSSNCATADLSEWSDAVVFTSLCDYLEIVAVDDTTCAGSTAILQVTGATTEVSWYATDVSLEALETGPLFETPELLETTSYWAAAAQVQSGQIAEVGEGASTSNSYQNPFYSLWSNIHSQHIILASEVTAAGLTAGEISSVALTVTNMGSLPMIDLSVKIGTTTATDLASFVDNSGFTTVYNSPSLMPTVGLNVLQFATPYMWDGTSNIVLEFCHGNPASSASMTRTVVADPTSYISTIKAHVSSAASADTACGEVTNQKNSYSVRPLFTFTGTAVCQAPSRTEVVATVNEVPMLTGNHIQTLTVDALEDATVGDLEPIAAGISWFATEADALAFINELPLTDQLVSGTTYYAVLTVDDCRSLPFDVTVTVTLGVANQTMTGLSYYPNPVQSQLNINYSENITSIVVFNLVGQKVMTQTPNSTNVILDMSTLSAGTYMIQVNADKASKVIKLIKK